MTEEFTDPENIPALSEYKDDEPQPLSAAPLSVEPPSPNVEKMPTIAPLPYLRKGKPANMFRALKVACINGAGFDFLATVGDMMRSKDFHSNKPGVAAKSRHQCGQAFDYNQDDKHLIVISEPKNGKQFFRTWLKCEKQDGSQGKKIALSDIRGYKTNVWSWDFTTTAESLGWERIPAWAGWQSSYTKKEFWHYQILEGTTWQQAMDYLYKTPVPTSVKTLRLGDKGTEVTILQTQLVELGYLSANGIDSDFGPKTELAVKALQKANGLTQDGVVGQHTVETINRLIKEKKMSTDFTYDTNEVNTHVSAELEEAVTPSPWYATSQFAVLLATYVLGPLALWLSAKGLITSEQAPAAVGLFQSVVVAGIGFVTHQFVKSRGEVSKVKAQAAAVRALAGTPGGPAALMAMQKS